MTPTIPLATMMRCGRDGCSRMRWMSHSTGLGSTFNSLKLAPKSVETSNAPISIPTHRRSSSSTMSLTWPMRGGGGKHHCETLATLRSAGSSRQVLPWFSLMNRWAGSDPTQTTSRPCKRPARADHRSKQVMPSLLQVQVAPPSSLRATPTPCVAANKVSSSAVTALTAQPASPRCLMFQAPPARSSMTTPSTVPTTILSERCLLRCQLVPPFDSKITDPSSLRGRGCQPGRRPLGDRQIDHRGEQAEQHGQPPHRIIGDAALEEHSAEPDAEEAADLVTEEGKPEQGREPAGAEHQRHQARGRRNRRQPEQSHHRTENQRHGYARRQHDERDDGERAAKVDRREQETLGHPVAQPSR